MFSAEMMAAYADLEFEDVMALTTQAEALLVDEIRADGISPVARTPMKALVAAHCALRRNLELTRAFEVAFNSGLFVPLFVIARAAVETGSLAFDLYTKAATMLDTGDHNALAVYEERITNVLLGSKSDAGAGDPEAFPAPNVLTAIDRLDRTTHEGLREMYEALSEYSHPNYAGLLESYTEPDPQERLTRFIGDPLPERVELLHVAFNMLAVGLSMAIIALEQLTSRSQEFAGFCEAAIHDEGTWPQGLSYPIARAEQA